MEMQTVHIDDIAGNPSIKDDVLGRTCREVLLR